MHGVERDDMARNIEFLQQFLHRRYLVGLFIDHDMRQHQRRIDSKSAEYLSCFGIVEGVETALERLPSKAKMRAPEAVALLLRSAACSRKTLSTSAGFNPCKI